MNYPSLCFTHPLPLPTLFYTRAHILPSGAGFEAALLQWHNASHERCTGSGAPVLHSGSRFSNDEFIDWIEDPLAHFVNAGVLKLRRQVQPYPLVAVARKPLRVSQSRDSAARGDTDTTTATKPSAAPPQPPTALSAQPLAPTALSYKAPQFAPFGLGVPQVLVVNLARRQERWLQFVDMMAASGMCMSAQATAAYQSLLTLAVLVESGGGQGWKRGCTTSGLMQSTATLSTSRHPIWWRRCDGDASTHRATRTAITHMRTSGPVPPVTSQHDTSRLTHSSPLTLRFQPRRCWLCPQPCQHLAHHSHALGRVGWWHEWRSAAQGTAGKGGGDGAGG